LNKKYNIIKLIDSQVFLIKKFKFLIFSKKII